MHFEEFLVSDILDVSWGDTKKTKSAYVESGYLAYSAGGPDGFLPYADYDCDGVVLSAIGANCGVTYLASGQWSCIKNTIRILSKKPDIDIKYFYYLTCHPDFWPKRGSAQPFISQTDVRDLRIKIPPIEIQKGIVGIVEQLDQKIKVNQQIASTLEQIAQTIFKSWFVDFDPVHAKARGEQPPGIDAETAALFPDSFEESEPTQIPADWEIYELGDLVQPKKGKVITKAKTQEGMVPVVAGGLEPAYFHNTANVQPPVVTISSSGANAGFVRLYSQPIWASDCTYISNEQTDTVLFWLQFLKFSQSRIFEMQQGGAQPHIYAADLMRLKIKLPKNTSLIRKYEEIIEPMFELIGNYERASETLAEIRDGLLPRLISGELEIPPELLEA